MLRSWVASAVRARAQAHGYAVVAQASLERVAFEAALARVLAHRRIDCVLDVGACRGEYGLALRRLGYRGRIVSFEPVEENYASLLQAAAGDAAWECVEAALGAEEQDLTLNLLGSATGHSLREPSRYAVERFGAANAVRSRRPVRVRRLDSILPAYLESARTPNVFLKLDTQGYDLEVLAGLGAYRSSVRALQVELSVHALYDDVPPLPAALQRLSEAGYQPLAFAPVLNEADGLMVTEFDALLVQPERP